MSDFTGKATACSHISCFFREDPRSVLLLHKVVAAPRFGTTACSCTANQQQPRVSLACRGVATKRSLANRDAGVRSVTLLATLTPLGGNTQDRQTPGQGGWIQTGGSTRPHLKPQFPRVAGGPSGLRNHASEPLHGDVAGTSQHKNTNNSAEPVDSRILSPVMERRPWDRLMVGHSAPTNLA